MFNNVFDIDFGKLLRWMIPMRTRMARLLAFLSALSDNLNIIYQQFRYNREANLYKLSITPQVCYLEKLLNDRYDYSQRLIYIDNAIDRPVTYIYMEDELKPVYLGKIWIYTGGETSQMADDFIIFVPMSIVFENAEMTSLVKSYKLAGTQFKIQRF